MTLSEYQKLAERTINSKLDKRDIELHALHEIASEVGEIHGLYQKTFQGHGFNEEELRKEIGDLCWGIAELCTAKEWKLDDICKENIHKLRRRYPDGFEAERSVHRERYE